MRVVLMSQLEHKHCADAVWSLRCRVLTSAGTQSAQQYQDGTSSDVRTASLHIPSKLPMCATGWSASESYLQEMGAGRHIGEQSCLLSRVFHLTLRAVCLAHHLNLNDLCPGRAV
jgi:hypothetical protein